MFWLKRILLDMILYVLNRRNKYVYCRSLQNPLNISQHADTALPHNDENLPVNALAEPTRAIVATVIRRVMVDIILYIDYCL